jgi:hypothetical protein
VNRRFYLALCPWACFVIADRAHGIGVTSAALLSCAVATSIAVFEVRARRTAALTVMGSALFLADGLLSLTTETWSPVIARYDRSMVAAVLAGCLAVSLSMTPLSERYTRPEVTPGQATAPAFRHYNRIMTYRWALAVGAIAASLAAGNTLHSRLPATMFNWLIPLLLVAHAASGPPVLLPSSPNEATSTTGILDALLVTDQSPSFRPRLLSPPTGLPSSKDQ